MDQYLARIAQQWEHQHVKLETWFQVPVQDRVFLFQLCNLTGDCPLASQTNLGYSQLFEREGGALSPRKMESPAGNSICTNKIVSQILPVIRQCDNWNYWKSQCYCPDHHGTSTAVCQESHDCLLNYIQRCVGAFIWPYCPAGEQPSGMVV